jgi:hypothetical protein
MQFGLLCYRNIATIAGTICTVVLSESSSKGKHDWGLSEYTLPNAIVLVLELSGG